MAPVFDAANGNGNPMSEQELLFMEALACSLEEEAQEEQLVRQLFEQQGFVGFEGATPAHHASPSTLPSATQGVDQLLLSTLPVSEWEGGTGTGEEAEECQLCLGEYELGDRVMRLPCLHQAHEECLGTWLAKSMQCPVCKIDVQECLSSLFCE